MRFWVVPAYTEVRELSRDTAGRVVLAWHDPTGTPVAIRYLSDELRAQDDVLQAFRVESHRLSEVDCPHVTRYYDYVESAEGAAIVMELLDGITLRAILNNGGPLDPLPALVVLKDALLGLTAIHARGVLHRDIRPEHILVDSEGRAKLIKIGLAWRLRQPGLDASGTRGDLHAAARTFAQCLGDPELAAANDGVPAPVGDPMAALVPARRLLEVDDPDLTDAKVLLDDLEKTALDEYGPNWEYAARDALAVRADRLLTVHAAVTGPDLPPEPRSSPARRTGWGDRVLIGMAVALAVAAALASLVGR